MSLLTQFYGGGGLSGNVQNVTFTSSSSPGSNLVTVPHSTGSVPFISLTSLVGLGSTVNPPGATYVVSASTTSVTVSYIGYGGISTVQGSLSLIG